MSKFPNAVNFTNTGAVSFSFISAHQNLLLNGRKGKGWKKTTFFLCMQDIWLGGDEAELEPYRMRGKCFCTKNKRGTDAFLWAQDCTFCSSTESWDVAKALKNKAFSFPRSCPTTDFSLWYSHTAQTPFFGKMPALLQAQVLMSPAQDGEDLGDEGTCSGQGGSVLCLRAQGIRSKTSYHLLIFASKQRFWVYFLTLKQ